MRTPEKRTAYNAYMRTYRLAHLEQAKKTARESYARNRDARIVYVRAYEIAHHEEILAKKAVRYNVLSSEKKAARLVYIAAWSRAHPDAMRKSRKRWEAANPEKIRERWSNYHARKLGAFVERVYRSVVFKRDQGICGICRAAVDPQSWHLDHTIPLSRGGEHSYRNTQVTHPACNLKKGCKIPPPRGPRW